MSFLVKNSRWRTIWTCHRRRLCIDRKGMHRFYPTNLWRSRFFAQSWYTSSRSQTGKCVMFIARRKSHKNDWLWNGTQTWSQQKTSNSIRHRWIRWYASIVSFEIRWIWIDLNSSLFWIKIYSSLSNESIVVDYQISNCDFNPEFQYFWFEINSSRNRELRGDILLHRYVGSWSNLLRSSLRIITFYGRHRHRHDDKCNALQI